MSIHKNPFWIYFNAGFLIIVSLWTHWKVRENGTPPNICRYIKYRLRTGPTCLRQLVTPAPTVARHLKPHASQEGAEIAICVICTIGCSGFGTRVTFTVLLTPIFLSVTCFFLSKCFEEYQPTSSSPNWKRHAFRTTCRVRSLIPRGIRGLELQFPLKETPRSESSEAVSALFKALLRCDRQVIMSPSISETAAPNISLTL